MSMDNDKSYIDNKSNNNNNDNNDSNSHDENSGLLGPGGNEEEFREMVHRHLRFSLNPLKGLYRVSRVYGCIGFRDFPLGFRVIQGLGFRV